MKLSTTGLASSMSAPNFTLVPSMRTMGASGTL